MSQRKAISYALFGSASVRHDNCFDFNSYLRGLMLSIRMNRIIYPDWVNVIHVGDETHRAIPEFFNQLHRLPDVEIVICDDAPLCKAMLWRMKPIFEVGVEGYRYSHVICRDLDSPTTYREAQCVQYWINRGKAAHAITDSVSHTIPMMGGMIGFVPSAFMDITQIQTWEDMVRGTQDFSRKGSDQDFLNRYIYPFFSQQGRDSITQHYMKGMPNTWLSDYHDRVPSGDVEWLTDEEKESDSSCGHIGAAGFYPAPFFKFIIKYKNRFEDLLEIEQPYSDIFYWTKDGTFA